MPLQPHSETSAAGPEFVTRDLDCGRARLASNYRAKDFQIHHTGIAEHGGPSHNQPNPLARLKRVLGGEADLLTAHFCGLAYANCRAPADLQALIVDVLLNGKQALLTARSLAAGILIPSTIS